MLNIVSQTIEYYIKKGKKPNESDIKVEMGNKENLPLFVTLYLDNEVIGSIGAIQELEKDIIQELIAHTSNICESDDFKEKINKDNYKQIKIRIDIIKGRQVAQNGIIGIEPLKSGIIAIKKDYGKMCVILPNISSKIISPSDYFDALKIKLGNDFKESEYILYEVETEKIETED